MTTSISGPPRTRGLPRPARRLLRRRADRLLHEIGRGDSELSLSIVRELEIADWNERVRHKERPTDVLAFSLLEGEGADFRGALLGDVVIGIETAVRQARRGRRTLDDEVARLLIHGTLHLVGYDHVEDDEARGMRAEERRLWRILET